MACSVPPADTNVPTRLPVVLTFQLFNARTRFALAYVAEDVVGDARSMTSLPDDLFDCIFDKGV